MDISLAAKKISARTRISRDEALSIYNSAPLSELARLAEEVKARFNPNDRVSFLIDRNINYTNVCSTDCSFCGFYRHNPKDPEAYVNSKEVIAQKINEALQLGATRILLQGGHNDELPYSYYTDLVSWINQNFPIEINAFSPPEIEQMMKISGKSSLEILQELKACGLKGLPGGGGEILDDEIRKRVSPKKTRSDVWINIMRDAQSIDLTTTATMVFGFGETIENRLNHFDRIRDLQDFSIANGKAGFNAFIMWPLQHNENTSMGRSKIKAQLGATSEEYLRMNSLARIYLDNIPHLQASWPTMGAETAKIALRSGCDDIGSTMMEENVVSKAGALSKNKWCMSPEELIQNIRSCGFIPAQRNTSFEILRTFNE